MRLVTLTNIIVLQCCQKISGLVCFAKNIFRNLMSSLRKKLNKSKYYKIMHEHRCCWAGLLFKCQNVPVFGDQFAPSLIFSALSSPGELRVRTTNERSQAVRAVGCCGKLKLIVVGVVGKRKGREGKEGISRSS
jgi:hypothetical protein